MTGPVMQHWYPSCAAVFQDLSTPIIMSASLLRTHLMQISYADMPGPLVTMENEKRFPFFHHSAVSSDNGRVQYPCWQLHGNFEPKTTHVSPNLTRGDHLVRGDRMTPVKAATLGEGGE